MKDGIFLSREVITKVLKFAEKSHAYRTALSGLWLDVTDKEKPTVMATDGHRLHQIKYKNDYNDPNKDDIAGTYLKKDSPTINLTISEVGDLVQKLREIRAVINVCKPKTMDLTKLTVKMTAQSILITADKRLIVRYIKPEGGIPKELVGMRFGVNVGYMVDAFELFDGHEVSVKIIDAISPIVIKNKNNDESVHVLMPMRLDGHRVS